MNVQDRQDCESDILRIQELLRSGIFDQANARHLFQRSAFIDLVICLRDLLHKAEQYATRVAFTDDILTNEYVKDVTGAITAVRDGCCHINSFKHLFDDRGNRGSYLVAYGKVNLMKIDDLELKSDYADDMAVFYGKNRLYLKRHIIRAFEEARALLEPVMKQNHREQSPSPRS
jgi:hypothetical protein